jgi:hypothetical protein
MRATANKVPEDARWTMQDATGREFWEGLATCEEEAFMMAERSVAGESDPPSPWKAALCVS